MVYERNNTIVYDGGAKCAIVKDDPERPAEVVAQVSVFRRERWLLLADYAAKAVSEDDDRDAVLYRIKKRLDTINAKLFDLTQNPIYDAR